MKNKIPLISVVIPAFNEEKTIAKCLDSLKSQTFQDFEVIVVDNNCIDKTVEITKTYNAKIVKEENQGITFAREKGFKHAQAKIIARTDADSVVPPDWLKKIYETMQKNPKVVAITGGLYYPDIGNIKRFLVNIYTEYGFYRLSKILMGHYPLTGPNCAIRKKEWQKSTPCLDDKEIHEDIDLSCHMSKFGKIKYFPDIKVVYSMRRWKKRFFYTLYEYGTRYIKSILRHHPYLRRHS